MRLLFAAGLLSGATSLTAASPCTTDPPTPKRELKSDGLSSRKADEIAANADSKQSDTSDARSPGATPPEASPILATLVQTHTREHLVLDESSPSQERLQNLLADRATGAEQPFDSRLLELLRSLARAHPGSRLELVSGFRSPKLNEMMRKKGRNVASHSQHSLGHAVDFRIVLRGAERGIAPADLEKEIRKLGWDGGVGVYPSSSDWFVHADVGRNRRWKG